MGIDFSVLLVHDRSTQQFKRFITNYAELCGWALAKTQADPEPRSRDRGSGEARPGN